MKIEQRAMRITDVPYVAHIDVNNTTCAIKFIGVSPVVFTKDQLREFHAAIGEAVKYMEVPDVEKPAEPRAWWDGDPEPVDVTVVIDCNGDRWEKLPSGRWIYNGTHSSSWNSLVCNYEPLREAK